MYYNWQGPVRVPAVLQYANKLATLVGDNLKIEPGKLMSDKLYYLWYLWNLNKIIIIIDQSLFAATA